jgi:Flp pilus assembly protein TadG
MNSRRPTLVSVSCGPRGQRSERGAAAAVVVLFTIALISVAGLVIDGGYALGAQRRAMNAAEQAARAGADQLDQGALRDGHVRVDPARAQAAALDYLHAAGLHGSVTISGDTVTVTVQTEQATTLLQIVGVRSLPITATASARSIDEDDTPGASPGVSVPAPGIGASVVGPERERSRRCVY